MTDIAAQWAAKERNRYRYFKPFVDAVKTFVAEAQDGERIYFGIEEFDKQMRGIGRGQLCIINGYAHSGKTLLTTHLLKHNHNKRILYFSPDEPAALVLAKLAAAIHGVPADEMEDRVAQGDQSAIDMLIDTATVQFPNLILTDQPTGSESMEGLYKEACEVWGAKPDFVVVDYAELVTAGETVPQKFDFLKGFGSRHETAMIVLHQTSRSAGAEGKRMTISSGSFGGEQHATFQLGVWRKQAQITAELIELEDKIARSVKGATESTIQRQKELRADLEKHEFTVTVAITKNKRPGRREGRSEIDFELYGETGILVPMGATDLPVQYRAMRDKQASERREAAASKGVEMNIPLDETWESFDNPPAPEPWDDEASF
jgi:KaiC/GvpD/RAD55 family RecA-like ATPase